MNLNRNAKNLKLIGINFKDDKKNANKFLSKFAVFVAARPPTLAVSSETSTFQSIPFKLCCFFVAARLPTQPRTQKPQLFR